MTPYPLIYVPHGTPVPACNPHLAPFGIAPGTGPDALLGASGQALDRGGHCWGAPMPIDPPARWTKTAAGWWVALDDHQPQTLQKITTHPRILRWRLARGASDGQWWRIPVLLTFSLPEGGSDPLWTTALEGVLGPNGWQDDPTLAALQQPLLALANRVRQHTSPDDNNRALIDLAISIAQLGHWIDRDLLIATGWLTERVAQRWLRAALDLGDEAQP